MRTVRSKGRSVAGRIFFLALALVCAVPMREAGGQGLMLPEYPASRLDRLLSAGHTADGPVFRNFLAEVVYASSLSRSDTSRMGESVSHLKDVLTRYPDVIGWLNGGLEGIAREAQVENLLGDARAVQAGIDSLICTNLKVPEVARRVGAQYEIAKVLPPGLDLCKVPVLQYVALSILERVYRDLDRRQRRELIDRAMGDSLFVAVIGAVNRRLAPGAGGFDISGFVDFSGITSGMPEKYAEVLNELLPKYYALFGDKHRLAVFYLMAMPERRLAALFQASGPALQKLFQMIADYSNDEQVKQQLNELKSGVRPFGEEAMRGMIDRLLKRSVTDSIYRLLEVDYNALGSGTIAQVHRVFLKDRSGGARAFVIKVKRPGLKEATESEMALFEEIGSANPFAQKLIRDVRATLAREANLGNEAEEVQAALSAYRHPRIRVAGLADFVTPSDSLIAFEFVEGRTLDKVNEKLDAVDMLVKRGRHGVNRPVMDHYMANLLSTQSQAVYELLKLWFDEAVFESGFFHGDLHSGNVFMDLEEGKGRFEKRFRGNYLLTLIDFGNTGRFTREQQRGVLAFNVGVARERPEEILEALKMTRTVSEADLEALGGAVERILATEGLTYAEKADRIATMAYIEGTTSTRDLLSFIRARILLETQLADLNRRLDVVDPQGEYKRYTAEDAYRSVVKKHVKWHCVRSFFLLRWRGNRLITCSEARALGRAAKKDRRIEALRALRKRTENSQER